MMESYDKYILSIIKEKRPFFCKGGGLKIWVKEQNKLYNDLISWDPDARYDEFDILFDNFIERPKYSCFCHNCSYEDIYDDAYGCELEHDEYPYKAYKCMYYDGIVNIPNTIEGWLYQKRYYYKWRCV